MVIVAPTMSLRKMQLLSVLALHSGAINHLFVISIHSIKLMNALNRNMISLPKFHSFIQQGRI